MPNVGQMPSELERLEAVLLDAADSVFPQLTGDTGPPNRRDLNRMIAEAAYRLGARVLPPPAASQRREDLERVVREALPWTEFFKDASMKRVHEQVTAALLAMAECETCKRGGYPPMCPDCGGTLLNQAALARGLNALEGG